MSITAFLNNQVVIMMLQLIVGKLWKANPKLNNAVIPWVSLILSLIGYTIMPAPAAAASALTGLAPYASTALLAVTQTLLVTGVHGFSKNALQPLWNNVLKALAYKVIGGGK
jgi:hypothetical protein